MDDLEFSRLLDLNTTDEEIDFQDAQQQGVINVSDPRIQETVDELLNNLSSVPTDEEIEAARELAVLRDRVQNIELAMERGKYEATKVAYPVFRDKKWKPFFKNLSNYLTSDKTIAPKQSAYRYMNVGEFLESFPLDDLTFIRDFREQFNMGFQVIEKPDGSVDTEKTVAANSIIDDKGHVGEKGSVVRFGRVEGVAKLWNKDKVDTGTALELLFHGMDDNEDTWKRRLKEYGSNDKSPDDALEEAGVTTGVHLMVNTRDPISAADKLEEYAARLREGWSPTTEANNVDKENEHTGSILGKKSLDFLQLPDETVVSRITLATL